MNTVGGFVFPGKFDWKTLVPANEGVQPIPSCQIYIYFIQIYLDPSIAWSINVKIEKEATSGFKTVNDWWDLFLVRT